MPTTNDTTGDLIQSRPGCRAYWDSPLWKKKKPAADVLTTWTLEALTAEEERAWQEATEAEAELATEAQAVKNAKAAHAAALETWSNRMRHCKEIAEEIGRRQKEGERCNVAHISQRKAHPPIKTEP